MTPSVVGEKNNDAGLILRNDWYDDLTIEELSAYVRYRYISITENTYDWSAPAHTRRRPARDGGKDSYGVKHSAVWPKAARAIRNAGAHPGIWIQAHFSFAANSELGPQKLTFADVRPSGLYSSASPVIYSKFLAAAPDLIADAARIAQVTISRRFAGVKAYNLSADDEKLYVFCDEGLVTATPFFRHVLAAAAGCSRAADKYVWPAAIHYDLLQPAYDIALADAELSPTKNLLDAVVTFRKKWSAINGQL